MWRATQTPHFAAKCEGENRKSSPVFGAGGAGAVGDGDGWQDRVSSSIPTIHLKTLSKFLQSKHTRSLWCNIIRREFNSTGITLAKVRPYPVYAHASNLNISRATRFAFSVLPLRQVNSRKLYLFTYLLLLSRVSTPMPNWSHIFLLLQNTRASPGAC